MLVLEWKKSGKELFFSPSVHFCGDCFAGSRIKINVHLGGFYSLFLFFPKESTVSQRFFLFSYKQNINVISSFSRSLCGNMSVMFLCI